MPGRDMDKLLEAWRSAERTRDECAPGSPAWQQAEAEAEAMRQLYHSLIEQRLYDEEDAGGGGDLPASADPAF